MSLFSLIVYNFCLVIGLFLFAPVWVAYLLLIPKVRAGFWEKLGRYSSATRKKLTRSGPMPKRIWFHVVSVGEFNAIKSLVSDLGELYEVVISTTTRTGHDLAQKTFPELSIIYFPFDLRSVIERTIQLVQPDLMMIAETEIWPNFIDMMSRQFQTPILLINGRLSQNSYQGYQWVRLVIKPSLQQITHLYMQSQADVDRVRQLAALPPEQITVAGNLKFDLIPTIDPVQSQRLSQLLNIHENDTVLTFASTHSGEDLPLVESYIQLKKDFPELKLILAPRHPERLPEIKNILTSKALSFSVRSQLSSENLNSQPIVILDSIGELLTVYSFSRIAVMGGSFIEKGGQNPLEPLSQRVPVIFGPYMHNFAEISRMVLEAQAGYQVKNQTELMNTITGLLTQPEIHDSIAEHGQRLIENNRGAKDIIFQAIQNCLN